MSSHQKLRKKPSGQFINPSNVVLEKCKSCSTNNISVERLMGQLDKTVSTLPSFDVFYLTNYNFMNDNETDECL